MTPRPSRATVERIIADEARRAGTTPDAVLNMSNTEEAKTARVAAIRRIAEETGCGAREIAEVWGMEPSTAFRALRRPEPAPPPVFAGPYDPSTIERLRWAHGDAKAAQIVAGKDPVTERDRRAWSKGARFSDRQAQDAP